MASAGFFKKENKIMTAFFERIGGNTSTTERIIHIEAAMQQLVACQKETHDTTNKTHSCITQISNDIRKMFSTFREEIKKEIDDEYVSYIHLEKRLNSMLIKVIVWLTGIMTAIIGTATWWFFQQTVVIGV